jgi:hypothetical protein
VSCGALRNTLEIGQLWVPGQTSQFIDFATSSLGAVIGVLMGRAAITALIGWAMRPSRGGIRLRLCSRPPPRLRDEFLRLIGSHDRPPPADLASKAFPDFHGRPFVLGFRSFPVALRG